MPSSAIHFAEPGWLWLLPVALAPLLLDRLRPRVRWPLDGPPNTIRPLPGPGLARLLTGLHILVGGLLVVALARPQSPTGEDEAQSSGLAIVVALDVSVSMRETTSDDPSTSRLVQARQAFVEFVKGRPRDLLGLVAFARTPDTACPPTLDHAFLIATAEAQTVAPPREAGTGLGDAIVWAGQEALATSARRQVVVLISDGRDEPGRIDALAPIEAAALAHAQGLVVHAIALPEPSDPSNSSSDNDTGKTLLAEIASAGGGQLFDAGGKHGLRAAFDELDGLERGELNERIPLRYRDWFPEVIELTLVLIGARLILGWTRLRTFP